MNAEKERNNEFTRGYICAVAGMLNGHGRDVVIEEALRGIGFSTIDLRIVDQYDKDILKKFGFIPRKKGLRK